MSKKKIIIYLLITLLISISSLIPVYAAGASVNYDALYIISVFNSSLRR